MVTNAFNHPSPVTRHLSLVTMFYYYVVKYGRFLVPLIPLRVAYALCWLLGWAVFWLRPDVRRAVLGNLGHVLPTASPGVRARLARRVIINQQKNYYDLMRLPRLTPATIHTIVAVEGKEH